MDTPVTIPTPLVSVVMSVYNGAAYLREAMESILNQSYANFEFIIINDGSKDDSLSIIKSYTHPKIKLIDNEGNKGLIYSLNKGIAAAGGKYIARMDADDISLPKRLEKQVRFLEADPGLGVCGCDYIQFSENKETHSEAFRTQDEIFGWMLFNASVVHPSLMIRASVLKEQDIIFNPEFKHAEDYELWSRLLFTCRFGAVNETLFKYREHSGQVTRVYHREQIASANRIRKNIVACGGFSFSESDLYIHNAIGSSQMLRSFEELQQAEKWLKSLLDQNKILKLIDELAFEKIIGKQWYDSCGNTNLGLKAFTAYFKSDLKNLYPGNTMKLIMKCIVRKFKK
jgi:glycosyltransferase involved in cell wall biosynthesis